MTDTAGNYRRSIEAVGSPGRACVTLRFYFDRAGTPDSVVIKDVFVDFKISGAGLPMDSVRVDAVLPP